MSGASLAYFEAYSELDRLAFLTCGSVDDGKSTLIGRLLYDSKRVLEDQLAALQRDSRRFGTRAGEMDFALLVDGLSAEREQGITIDVAYRYFATERRRFKVADTPGHEQYTRNMATGASNAEAAVILVDAQKGILEQTRRHSYIASLFGIRCVLLAVNKMDLADYNEQVFNDIRESFLTFSQSLEFTKLEAIPICAITGGNVTRADPEMPWFKGPTLLEYLETLEPPQPNPKDAFVMPVQWVNRPHQGFRGYAGTVTQGEVRVGDAIRVLPGDRQAQISGISTQDGDLDSAKAGQAVTLSLAQEIDTSRGDVICSAESPISETDQFAATLLWMGERPLLVGRQYLLKIGTRSVATTVTELKHRVSVNTLEHLSAKQLAMNEVGVCNLFASERIACAPFRKANALGRFILIDRHSMDTVGVGLIEFSLRRADNLRWQQLAVDRHKRATIKGQRPCTLWFTGLSGSGKSTIANLLESRLNAMHRHSYLLDGDNIRHGINRDLGFTNADRVENIRRVGEISRLMVDAGLIAIVAFISPFRSERRFARALLGEGEFIEIYLNTPLEVCEARDAKGLYARARSGEIQNFTGIDSDYEAPESAEITLDTAAMSAEECVELIMKTLQNGGYLEASPALET